MTEVERAEVILNDAEKRVAKARKDLREARITEAVAECRWLVAQVSGTEARRNARH